METTSPCAVDGKATEPVSTCMNSPALHGLEFGKKQPRPLVLPLIFPTTVHKSLLECIGTEPMATQREYTILTQAFKSILFQVHGQAVARQVTTTTAVKSKESLGVLTAYTS